MRFFTATTLLTLSTAALALVHPGMLHTAADFARVKDKVNSRAEPWLSGFNKLTANSHAQSGYQMRGPLEIVIRGTGAAAGAQNFVLFYNDIAAAYQLALRWKITDDTAFADAAIAILDAWSGTLKQVTGNSDRFLATGLYGYQFANAAEIMRGYAGWPTASFNRFRDMMVNIFLPDNIWFLDNHNDAAAYHYRANWDICNMASQLAIAILADDQAQFDAAISRFTTTTGNGNINHFIWKVYQEEGTEKPLGQNEESGRDQGHATLDFALIGAYAQMAYNQGVDLFGYNNSQILAGSEYTAKYNLGHDVPYTPLVNKDYNEQVISANSRGTIRPAWELLFAHYAVIKDQDASWTGEMRDLVGVEGGGGDYGPNSGGFDQLGFGTLMYRLE